MQIPLTPIRHEHASPDTFIFFFSIHKNNSVTSQGDIFHNGLRLQRFTAPAHRSSAVAYGLGDAVIYFKALLGCVQTRRGHFFFPTLFTGGISSLICVSMGFFGRVITKCTLTKPARAVRDPFKKRRGLKRAPRHKMEQTKLSRCHSMNLHAIKMPPPAPPHTPQPSSPHTPQPSSSISPFLP